MQDNYGLPKNPYGSFDFTGSYKTGNYEVSIRSGSGEVDYYNSESRECYTEIDKDKDGNVDEIKRTVSDKQGIYVSSQTLTLDEKKGNEFKEKYSLFDTDGNYLTSYKTWAYDKDKDGNYEKINYEQYSDSDCNLDDSLCYAQCEDVDNDGTLDKFFVQYFDGSIDNVVKTVSNIKNQYYEGDTFEVNWEDSVATITNTNTQQTYTYDVDRAAKRIADKYKEVFLKQIKKVPGEVLADYALHDVKLENIEYERRYSNRAYYSQTDDKIHFRYSEEYLHEQTLCHELAHAIDYDGYLFNTPLSSRGQFMKDYEEELNNYLADGNERWVEDDPWDAKIYTKDLPRGAYCTSNEREMFAEAFTRYKLGYSESDEVIDTYFPKSFENAKAIIEKREAQKQGGFFLNAFNKAKTNLALFCAAASQVLTSGVGSLKKLFA